MAKCICEIDGTWTSGLPGVLAKVKAGKILSEVERCDICGRYQDDVEAREALKNFLLVRAKWDTLHRTGNRHLQDVIDLVRSF